MGLFFFSPMLFVLDRFRKNEMKNRFSYTGPSEYDKLIQEVVYSISVENNIMPFSYTPSLSDHSGCALTVSNRYLRR
jgi:hypothetical protein